MPYWVTQGEHDCCSNEIPYVGNTVTNHVQAPEMHNQAANSLALMYASHWTGADGAHGVSSSFPSGCI